ncbi:MAG TPA: EAL domain-containing protein [Bryobacteraceae bacterium]|nr:EAL domain-containing protein [Bryobacteraceae bacterium]
MRRVLLGAMILAAILGSILGGRALNEAVVRARDLYRVDTGGSQMESGLEYETQESRRAFLYALAVTDPNDQLPYVAEARAANQRVEDELNRLRMLGVPEITGNVKEFERAWNKYDEARDDIIALILEGNAPEALRVESGRGKPAFALALGSLHALKAALEVRARADSFEVNATLKRSIGALAAFAVSTLLIVALLIKSNRSRLRALESLRKTHRALAGAEELAKQRVFILEMVSTHAVLARTLDKIAALASRSHPEAGVAIWAGNAGELRFQVGANLPRELASALELHPPPPAGPAPAALEQFAQFSRKVEAAFGYEASPPRELREASGERIGMLQMFAPAGSGVTWQAMLDAMAQLAAVAIENSLLYERLAFQAQHDTLTGLPNRLLFQDRVQQAMRSAARHGKKAAVIWIDLDKYKHINDTLGHRVGDEVLCEVGRRLETCLRQSDSVARVGGDEFTVLVQDLAQAEDAERVADKILAAFALPFQLSTRDSMIAASLGISIFPDHGDDPITLLRNADLAMYSAKRAGGGTYRMFRSALSDSMEHRVMIERELKTALARNELTLEYQPLLDKSGRLDCVEALLRWNNPIAGRVSPAEFIPIAEETGLIPAIGEWVTRTACNDGARWLREGYDVPRIAVNVSPLQFINGGFTALVERTLAECGLPASRLEFEITETALMNNLENVIEQIEMLRRLGVRFAIDDFGTGYSSLSHLRNLPVDCVKIDRSFIKDLETGGEGCTTLVRGIIALAHSLRLQVVAEGVETAQQLALLKALGCDVNQGFFLHRPMSVESLEALLRTTRARAEEEEASENELSVLVSPA